MLRFVILSDGLAIFHVLFSILASFYTPFFKEVFEKKSEIEHAFSMEDAARLDDSGEGTLERPMRGGQPMPPPRMDSYRVMRGSGSRSNSGRLLWGSSINYVDKLANVNYTT